MKLSGFTAAVLFFIVAVIFAIGCIVSGDIVDKSVAMTSYAAGDSKPVIIVDAGHGGMDGGAVGVDGVEEKDLNLSVALKLEAILKAMGYDVVMTRTTDQSLHDPDVTGIHNQKISDLKNRLKIAGSYDYAILISIHMNKFPDKRYYGAQVFYSRQNEESKALAEILQLTLRKFLDPNNKRECKRAEGSYILDRTRIPAVIVECGFLSNEEENKLLQMPEYQKKLAFSIFSAIDKYLAKERTHGQ